MYPKNSDPRINDCCLSLHKNSPSCSWIVFSPCGGFFLVSKFHVEVYASYEIALGGPNACWPCAESRQNQKKIDELHISKQIQSCLGSLPVPFLFGDILYFALILYFIRNWNCSLPRVLIVSSWWKFILKLDVYPTVCTHDVRMSMRSMSVTIGNFYLPLSFSRKLRKRFVVLSP